MKIFSRITTLNEFDRELKSLSKRFVTLTQDLDTFIRAQLALCHKQGVDNKGIVKLHSHQGGNVGIYKARKFACRSLKGRGSRSGIRIIYSYDLSTDHIEFIEIYFKGDKPNEDRARISAYLSRLE